MIEDVEAEHACRTARATFAEAALRSEEELDLGRAAALLATIQDPSFRPEPWLERLDTLGRTAAQLLSGVPAEPRARAGELARFLAEDAGLAGDRDDYYDPRNSYLHEVLTRRRGIPISLAVVLLEVGRRAGVPLQPIGFPAHFLVRAPAAEAYVDLFHGPELLDEDGCRGLLARMGRGVPFSRVLLRPATKRATLVRMLRNLKGAHAGRGEPGRALEAAERLLLLDPGAPGDLRDRGLLYLETGRYARAVADLERYLRAAPHAPDAGACRARREEARSKLWTLN